MSSTPESSESNLRDNVYPLEKTKELVETAMLAAISGLLYLLSSLLRLDNSLGYITPFPPVLAAVRNKSAAAGWRTVITTACLVMVLLGPLRAAMYVMLTGLPAGVLGAVWTYKWGWWPVIAVGAATRVLGQMGALALSSMALNENIFSLMLSNIYSMLDHISSAIGASGAPSPAAVMSMIFSLLVVNGVCFVFLLQVIYRILLQSMGYDLGPQPAWVRKWLSAGTVRDESARQG